MAKRHRLDLTDEQEQELIEHRDHHPRPDVREKAAALLKIAQGASPHSVARSGLLKPRDPDTVYAWLKRYLSEGCDGLINYRHGGARRKLSQKKNKKSLIAYAKHPETQHETR